MKAIARKVEKVIIMVLIFLMFLVLITATIDLGLYLFRSIYNAEYFLMDFDALIDVFGAFLLVLIGIELLDTIKVYLRRNLVHVEVVVLVAIIALARKIVVLRIDEYSGEILLGLAAMITALAVAYYLIRRAGLMEYQIDSDDNERRPKTQINKNLEEK